jgi:hypothetical protein
MSCSETTVTEAAVTAPSEVRTLCRHLFTDGRRCGSPALRGIEGPEPFCYYHHTHRKPAPRRSSANQAQEQETFLLPDLEDRSAIQVALSQVLQRVATGQIEAKCARLLLSGLQIALRTLPREPRDFKPEAPIEQTVDEPELGTVAPAAEFSTRQQRDSAAEKRDNWHITFLESNIKRRWEQIHELTAERDQAKASADQAAARIRELEAQLTVPTIQAVADTESYEASPNLTPIRTRLYEKNRGARERCLHRQFSKRQRRDAIPARPAGLGRWQAIGRRAESPIKNHLGTQILGRAFSPLPPSLLGT